MSKDRVFTQDEVNEIVKKRLERERNKNQDTDADTDAVENADPKNESEKGEAVAPEDAQRDAPEAETRVNPNDELQAEIEALRAQNERLAAESLVSYAKQQMRDKYFSCLFDSSDINCLGVEDYIMPLVDLTSKKTVDKTLDDLSMFMSELLNYHVDRIKRNRNRFGTEQQQISSIFQNQK